MTLIRGRTTTTTASKGAAAPRFQYRQRTAEEVKQRANRQIGARDSFLDQAVEFFTPKAGDNTVRIMPPTWDDAHHYGVDLYIHYRIGPDESAYLCLDKMKGEPCPLCEERTRASAAGEESRADELAPRSRVAVWVIDRSQEGKGPLVWNMPAGLDKDISGLCVDKQTRETYFIDHPEDGYDVSFKREGMDQRTKYASMQIGRRPTPLSQDAEIAQKWLDYIAAHPLPALLQFRDYDTIKNAYRGQAPAHAEAGSPAPTTPAAPAAPAAPVVRRRVTAAAPAPAVAPVPVASADLPSWEEVHTLDEDALAGLIADFEMQPPAEGFTALEEIQDWVCTQLNIVAPAPVQPTPAAPVASGAKLSWKERLRQQASKSGQ